MKNQYRRMKYVVGGLAVLLISSSASAYNIIQCDGNDLQWTSSNTITLRAHTGSFPVGSTYRSSLRSLINHLNNNPSNFTFDLQLDENDVELGNGENETWYTNDPDEIGSAPAVAKYWFYCGSNPRLAEVDVLFDDDRTWTAGVSKGAMTPYGGSARPFKTTAAHEYGHYLGLAHVSSLYNVMGQDWDHIHANGSLAYGYFGEDASNGAVHLYNVGANKGEDVGVVHWRWTGNSGEYSRHGRTRVFDTNGSELWNVSIGGEPRYEVDNGQTIDVEFTYENNGVSYQPGIEIGFYLSTNDYITTHDRLLRTASINLARDTVWTTTHRVTLPSDLDPNQDYHIGVIVDHDDSIDESWERNNATYIGLRTSNFTPPTSTPTPEPTDTPTPTPPLDIDFPIPTPIRIPTIEFPPILTPTPIFELPEIVIPRPILELESPQFEQKSTVLKETMTLISADPENPSAVLPEYRFGFGSEMMGSRSIALKNGSLLTTAYKGEALEPYLVIVTPEDEVVDFGKVELPELQVGDKALEAESAQVLSMSYDGYDTLHLLIRVQGSTASGNEAFETVVKNTIRGSFDSTEVGDFLNY